MPTCPKCKAEIPVEDVNVAQGVAVCRACGAVTTLASIAEPSDPKYIVPSTFDPASPPRGVSYSDDGREAVITACFATPLRIVIPAFALVWCGATTAIVVRSLTTASPPIWFCIPFVLFAVLLLTAAVFLVMGRVRVRLSEQAGEVFSGVGSLGRRRAFDPAQVTAVRLVDSTSKVNDQPVPEILIDGPTPVRFGCSLPAARRTYVAAAIRSQLGL